MFDRSGRSRRLALIPAAAMFAAMPAYGLATGDLPALDQLEPGRWQVRDLDAKVDRQILCIGDPMLLAQIEHGGPACAAQVIESGPSGGTVRYTCQGRGFGHSTIKIESPRLAKIRTQGISSNRPFYYQAEARRIGPC